MLMENKGSRYSKVFHVRWADCDFNGHMRHSAFNDYAAHIRVSMFTDFGLPMERLMGLRLGPVLFREETKFYKELRLNEAFIVDCEVIAMRKSGKIWQMHHRFYTEQGLLAAEIVVDGSWIDLDKRKTATPNKEILDLISAFPRADEFTWLPDKR
jgi:acyl-CoA thioester hydrolase